MLMRKIQKIKIIKLWYLFLSMTLYSLHFLFSWKDVLRFYVLNFYEMELVFISISQKNLCIKIIFLETKQHFLNNSTIFLIFFQDSKF